MTAKETEDLEFLYDDADCYENEISELYTYTEEEQEFKLNQTNFEELLNTKDLKRWIELNSDEKTSIILHIIQVSELTNKSDRFKAITWILYLAQGVFGECSDNQQQRENCRLNCFLLYKLGLFTIVQDLLIMEVNSLKNTDSTDEKKTTLLSIADCQELRYLINILYTMVETLRRSEDSDSQENVKLRIEFLTELEQSLSDAEPFFIVLFNMVLKFCSQPGSNLPMRKVLLLLWKLLLTMLGGVKSVQVKKISMRKEAGLSILDEDPIAVMREMKASTPPTSASDILEMGPGKKRNRKYDFDNDNTDSDLELNNKPSSNDIPFEEEKVTIIDEEPVEESRGSGNESDTSTLKDDSDKESEDERVVEIDQENAGPPPGIGTPMPSQGPTLTKDTASIAAKLLQIRKERQQEAEKDDIPVIKVISGLPWIPKAKERDFENFLNMVRVKFIGYTLPGDLTTVAGLPKPTQDSINVLKKHVFTSLADVQVKKEAEMLKYPLTIGKDENIPDTVAERVYQAMLLQLPQYIIALLKILLAAAPTSKAKTDSINILSDVLPEDMPTNPVASLRLGIDVNRHREVIVKSVSGLLLLLLKHFKQSHIYQFEYASQHLVFANCIPLVLKFFNQNIVAYVTTKNTIPSLEFPNCVIGEKIELTAEIFEGMDAGNVPCWRNLFSSINLMRVLNKLVKSKHSRTMMLVVFKSAPILKRALKVRQAMFQLYVLKLLKIQTKYLGRAWRKTNMKTMSAIYQKVRHHLNDDWAFGNDVDARPWDFQQEESSLRAFVERFNIRRYKKTGSQSTGAHNISCGMDEDYEPVDNNLQNLLKEEVEMPPQFSKSYEVWLEREVYSANTDWDQLLKIQCVQ